MGVDTVFYIIGLVATAGALLVSFAGLKLKNFPSRGAMTGILTVFAALVVVTCGLAVAVAREEQGERREEQAAAAKQAEEAETPAEDTDQAESDDAGDEPDAAADQAAGAGGTLELVADEAALAYDKTELEVAAGEVTIDFDNPSPIPHDVVIRDQAGEDVAATEIITQAQETLVTELAPGDYQFYCSVPGHEEAGMVGTLTVTE